MNKIVGSKTLLCFGRLTLSLAVFLSVSLSQIQLVDDGADTTSPETPEPGTGKVPKRGKDTHIQTGWCCPWSFFFFLTSTLSVFCRCPACLKKKIFAQTKCNHVDPGLSKMEVASGTYVLRTLNMQLYLKAKEEKKKIEIWKTAAICEHADRDKITFLWWLKNQNSSRCCRTFRSSIHLSATARSQVCCLCNRICWPTASYCA